MAWTREDANKLYGVSKWGSGYFNIDDDGCITVEPCKDGARIRIIDVIEEAKNRGLRLPLHIRFQDILQDRVKRINEAFAQAIEEAGYKGRYQGVYPVKVNQMREVVETLMDAGEPYGLGIEAGSKPELLLALSIHKNDDRLLLCNGYKDDEFIRFALMGCKIGKKVVVVAEKLEEIKGLIDLSKEMGVRPYIGIRIKLATRSSGKWATSSGEAAKFGLSTVDLLEAMNLLEQAGLKDCITLLHFHVGSQIPDIQVITRCVREGARFYAKLVRMGCPISYIDVGGGLGVDYDGSRSAVASSANYSLREYANTIVYGIMDICDEEKVKHPSIVSESGRALVAHHSMIAVEAFGRIAKLNTIKNLIIPKNAPKVVRDILEVKETVDAGHYDEAFHDLVFYRQQAMSLFDLGYLDLQSRAVVESLSWEILAEISRHYEGKARMSEEMKELVAGLKDQYLLNFSVFRSLPDSWALGQLFPMTPLSRLNEEPTIKGTIADITCDSDGKVDTFIGDGEDQDQREYLWLHDLNDKPYYIGIFLTGAYQDTLGDMHNLFGRMDEAHIVLDSDEEEGWYIDETIEGDTIREVLEENEYAIAELIRSIKTQVEQAIKKDVVKPNEGMKILSEYEAGLKRYTYLQVNSRRRL
ncbi:MAG TPA: biosynthetic arginine decarboxylase [Treponema sp.]|nr:biosynthetic arginine decarboxylase [Treponema sp.]HRS05031.1 biosynthetic arginine decarboxylase [Treponema sp.]HRU28558.1 biosynthetic arginine decarboxylase [Treponema sp.]